MGTRVKATTDVFVPNGLGVYELGDWDLGENIYEDVPSQVAIVEDAKAVRLIEDAKHVELIADLIVVPVRDTVHVELA